MTENESVLSTLQNAIDCATDDITRTDLEIMVKCLEEIQQYRAIGTVEELQALKEMSEPKKPIEIRCGCYSITKGGRKEYVIINKCPNCGSEELMNSFPCRCGQKIDWQ